jgi:hypothetical protein
MSFLQRGKALYGSAAETDLHMSVAKANKRTVNTKYGLRNVSVGYGKPYTHPVWRTWSRNVTYDLAYRIDTCLGGGDEE